MTDITFSIVLFYAFILSVIDIVLSWFGYDKVKEALDAFEGEIR